MLTKIMDADQETKSHLIFQQIHSRHPQSYVDYRSTIILQIRLKIVLRIITRIRSHRQRLIILHQITCGQLQTPRAGSKTVPGANLKSFQILCIYTTVRCILIYGEMCIGTFQTFVDYFFL